MAFKPLLIGLCFVSAIMSTASAADYPPSSEATQETLKQLIASDKRPTKQKARDKYRRPLETLTFCGIEPEMTVVEIWPGGQGAWYRRIVRPLVENGGGAYYPVGSRSRFPEKVDKVPYGEADMVLVFRAHGFMIYKQPAQTHVNAVFDMLRPGGVLCIVDHAGDEAIPQDPEGDNGYVNESHFRMLAERAGFNFIAASEHNRNSKDNKDHPRGVWSLPPALSGTLPLTAERKKYLAIGESDRFTHKYYKPEE
ncbi:MAG: class I SAM-dependent methyltransferase [Alphaproteobacteria bacterium]|nr:class I SAM-dependent methyltransferase [Alphaproteobacteria bacterium]